MLVACLQDAKEDRALRAQEARALHATLAAMQNTAAALAAPAVAAAPQVTATNTVRVQGAAAAVAAMTVEEADAMLTELLKNKRQRHRK